MNSFEPTINRRIEAPKYFRPRSLTGFINSCKCIFELSEQLEENFLLDLSKVKDVKLLPILVIYKVMEYSLTKNCFKNPLLKSNNVINEAFEKYGFTDLIRGVMNKNKSMESEYKKLKISRGENFIMAPRALLRSERSSRSMLLNRDYLPEIEKYYINHGKGVEMIMQVFSEVLLNFWEHAVDDSKSIIVAYGNRGNIEIACADTGNGIISTLKPTLGTDLSAEQILLESIKKGVTSKRLTHHMGHGLWILDEIVSKTKGIMHLYSEGAFYTNDQGKKESGRCGFWKGTIISVSLPLYNPVTLSDFDNVVTKDININWT